MFVEGEQSEARYFRIPKDVGERISRGVQGHNGDAQIALDKAIALLQQDTAIAQDEKQKGYLNSLIDARNATQQILQALSGGCVEVVATDTCEDLVMLPDGELPLETELHEPTADDIKDTRQAVNHRFRTNLAIAYGNMELLGNANDTPLVQDAHKKLKEATVTITHNVDEVADELLAESILVSDNLYGE